MPWNPAALDPEWPFEIYATRFTLAPRSTALLVIDLQRGSVALSADGVLAKERPALAVGFNRRLAEVVIPNVQRLMQHFRGRQLHVVHTRNGAMTPSAREMTRRLRPRIDPRIQGQAVSVHRGTPSYELDERVAPLPEELVIDKSCSGAFTQTGLDHALRNMGVTGVVCVGVMTDMCVLGTARTAAELGYDTVICADACATVTERAHNEALLMHARVFGRVAETEEVIAEL